MKTFCCLLVYFILIAVLIMETSEQTNIDIYDDVCDFDLGDEVEKLKSENKQLGEHILILEENIETLQGVISKLRETQTTLKKNISALFLTAKSEIDRKDRMITELRTQIDNICFRRDNYAEYKRKGRENVPVDYSAAKRFKYEYGNDNRDRYEDTHDRSNRDNYNRNEDSYDRNSRDNYYRNEDSYDRNRFPWSNDDRNKSRNMETEEWDRDDRGRRYNDREQWIDKYDITNEYRRSDDKNFEGRSKPRSLERLKCDRQSTPVAEQKYSKETKTSNSPIVVIDLEKEPDIKKPLTKQTPKLSRTISETSSTDSEGTKLAKKHLKLMTGLEKKKKKIEAGSCTKQRSIKKETKPSWHLIEVEKDIKIIKNTRLKSENPKEIKQSRKDTPKRIEVDCMIDLTEAEEEPMQEEEMSSFMDFFVIKDEDQDENIPLVEIQPEENLCENTTKKMDVEAESPKTEVTGTISKEKLAEKNLTDTSEDCGTLSTNDKAQEDEKKEMDVSTEEINSSKIDGKNDQSAECSTKEDSTVPNIETASKIVQKSSQTDTSGSKNEECSTEEDNTVATIEVGSKIVQKSSQTDTSGPKNEEGKDSSTVEPEKSSKEEHLKHDVEKTSTEVEKEPANIELPAERLTKVVDTEKKDDELEKNIKDSLVEISNIENPTAAGNIIEITVEERTPFMNMPSLFDEENVACPKEDKRRSTETLKVDGGDESAKRIEEEMPIKKKKVAFAEDVTNFNLKQNTTTAFFVKNKTREADDGTIKDPLEEDKANSAEEGIKSEDKNCRKDVETMKNLEPAKVSPKNKRSTSIEDIATRLEKKLHSLFDSENSIKESVIVEEDNTCTKSSRERSDAGVVDEKRSARDSSKEDQREREKLGLKRRRSDGPLIEPKRKINYSKEERKHFSKKDLYKGEPGRSSKESLKEHKPKAEEKTKAETNLKNTLEASKIISKQEDSKRVVEAKQWLKQWKIPKLKEPQAELKKETFSVESRKVSSKIVDISKALEQKSKEQEPDINAECLKIAATHETNKEKDIPDQEDSKRQDGVLEDVVSEEANLKVARVRRESLKLVEESKDLSKTIPEFSKMHAKEKDSKENVETGEDIAVFSLLAMGSTNCETLQDKMELLTTRSTSEDVPVVAKPEPKKKNTSKTNVRRGSVLKEDSPKPREENQSKTVAKQCPNKENITAEEKTQLAADCNNPDTIKDIKNSQRKDVAKDTTAKHREVTSGSNRRRSTSRELSSKTVEKLSEESQLKMVTECSKIDAKEGGKADTGTKEKTQLPMDCSNPNTLKDKKETTKDSQRRNDATAKQRQESKKVASKANSRRGSTLKEGSPKTVEKSRRESGSKLVVVCSKIDDEKVCGQEDNGTKEKTQPTMDYSNPEIVEDKIKSTTSAQAKDDVAKDVMPNQRQELKKVVFSMQTRANSRRKSTLKEDSPKTAEKTKKVCSETEAKCEDRKEDIATEEKAQLFMKTGSPGSAQDKMKPVENSRIISRDDSGPKLKITTEESNSTKTTEETITNEDKTEESQTEDELKDVYVIKRNNVENILQETLEQSSATIPKLQKTVKETRRRVKITSIAVSKNTKSKLTPKKCLETCEDDLDSDSSTSTNTSKLLEEERTKVVHNRLDNLIKNYIEDSSAENINDISNNQIEDDKKSLVNNIKAPGANTRTRRRFRWSESESEQIKSPISTRNSTPTTNSPDTLIPRRRITPTPVKDDKPICSFENILEKTAKSPSFQKVSPLHLTHDGEIPVLHLEENHINNMPTESNINDKNIMSLLDSMNISNLECDTPKFKNVVGETAVNSEPNSKESNLNISPIKRNDNLTTFENIIKKVTSTPIVSSGKPAECATNAVSSDKAVNPPAPPQSVRRRRRCRLIIAD